VPEITALRRNFGHVLTQLAVAVGAGSPWEAPTRDLKHIEPQIYEQETHRGSVGGMVGRGTVCRGLGGLGYVP